MHERTFKREQVVEMLSSVLCRVSQKHSSDEALISEVNQLKQAIDRLRKDLNGVKPDQIQMQIPSATDELDAVVEATEEATHTIMEACEAIQDFLKDKPAAQSAVIESETIRIVEACTFQDITGQRIAKVIRSLQEIERHAAAVNDLLSERFCLADMPQEEPRKENGLMNGPQLPGKGITQEEIDNLLSDF